MAGSRATGLRRTHTIAKPLLYLVNDIRHGQSSPADWLAWFRLTLPDGRLKVALTVAFAPDVPGLLPSDAIWGGYWAAGLHGLVVQARETLGEVCNQLLPVDNVFGSPAAPAPVPGGTYGWLISDEPDAREWLGLLAVTPWVPGGPDVPGGKWGVQATLSSYADMSDEEWERVANRLQLDAGPPKTAYGGGPT